MDNPGKIVGENLRRRRLILGWGQDDAADRLDMSRVTYGRLEKGEARLTDDLWTRIMEVFAVTSDVLLSVPETCEYRFFRKNARQTAREGALLEEATREVVRKMRDYTMLEKIVEEGPGQSERNLQGLKLGSGESIDEFAGRVRNFLCDEGWDDNENLPSVLESLGIKLFMFPIHIPKFFGFSFAVGREKGILVNCEPGISGERRLFTLAHELGHMLLHGESALAQQEYAKNGALEDEANRFASRLLMPDAIFRKVWGECFADCWVDRVLAVKRRFRVSYKTVLYRLGEERDGDGRSALFAGFLKQYEVRYGQRPTGTSEPKPFPFAGLVTRRMSRLALKAFFKGEITESRLAEILGKSFPETREIVSSSSGEFVA